MIRIVAMLLVVALHCMDYGGFIKLSEDNLFVSLNHTISICAVNCFALISGYLLTDGSKRWNKLAVLWIGSLLLFGLFCSIVQYFFSRKSYVTICVQKLLSDINKPILVFYGLWEILQSVPDGQKSSYLVQVILKDQENNQLEKSIRQAIREELAGVSISGSGERVSKKEEIPSQMLDFLSGLEDAF